MLGLSFNRKRSLKKQVEELTDVIVRVEEKLWDLENYLNVSQGYVKRGGK